jgi:hypothetical protein
MERVDHCGLTLRRFSSATETIANVWSSCASSGDAWTSTGVVWGTENAPVQVVNRAGLTGVQKPGKPQPTNPHTAATEKIVADLAHCLGLPIPPATLWDRGSGASAPRLVAVSAWAFDNALTWGQVEKDLTPTQRAALVPLASAMIPFERWIGAEDRQNAGNVLVGVVDGGRVFGAWIDFAFALDHGWKGNVVQACHVPPIFPPIGPAQGDVVKAIADRIARMENSAIEGVVNRVPVDYLPRPVADNIIRNLLARRNQLRARL